MLLHSTSTVTYRNFADGKTGGPRKPLKFTNLNEGIQFRITDLTEQQGTSYYTLSKTEMSNDV